MVKAAKAEGLPLSVETCHHYLRSFIIRLVIVIMMIIYKAVDGDEDDDAEDVSPNLEIC